MEEFVDPGYSGRTLNRPDLQRMFKYIKTHQVTYCIVYKLDRLARDRLVDLEIQRNLIEAGVTLVSVTESIDETPSGTLVHGVMSAIAEFYSKNLAAEVTKGLTQKIATGGTPGRAPLGYLNVRKHTEEVPRRAPGRATRMAVAVRLDPATRSGAFRCGGEQLGIDPETLRALHRATIDAGGRTSRDHSRGGPADHACRRWPGHWP